MSNSKSNQEDEIKTIFTELIPPFPSSPNSMKTREFLNACVGIVSLIEKFGKVFMPVIYDMNNNIKKLNEKFEENPSGHVYLEEMILKEQQGDVLVATDALQWLRRGLHFISIFFKCILEDTLSDSCSNDLAPFLHTAYAESLEQYHGWLGTQLFSILSRFAPDRKRFINVLALEDPNNEPLVLTDLRVYTNKMHACVKRLVNFYQDHNIETYVSV